MNLALRGIEANLGPQWGDSFHDDQHPDLRADFILANPPFNISDWGGENLRDDPRWKYGTPARRERQLRVAAAHAPPPVAHRDHGDRPRERFPVVEAVRRGRHPQDGRGRRRRVHRRPAIAVVLHAQNPRVPVVPHQGQDRRGRSRSERPQRDRKGEVLFIDAREMGYMETRTHRDLSPEDVAQIADTYNAWRGEPELPLRRRAGVLRHRHPHTIKDHGYVLTPGRYVGAAEVEGDGEPLDEKIARLSKEVRTGFAQRRELQSRVERVLDALGADR